MVCQRESGDRYWAQGWFTFFVESLVAARTMSGLDLSAFFGDFALGDG